MNAEHFQSALLLYKALSSSESGYIEKNESNAMLFADFYDYEVSKVLDLVCQTMEVNIFKGEKDILYITPKSDSVGKIREEDIRRYFYEGKQGETGDRSERVYLFYYTTLIMLDLLFGGSPIEKKINYLTFSKWMEAIEDFMVKHKSISEEEEAELAFNFSKIRKKWDALSLDNDKAIAQVNTKVGFLNRCLQFLTKEGLIFAPKEDEILIYPTSKLCDLVKKGQLNFKRLEDLHIATNIENAN